MPFYLGAQYFRAQFSGCSLKPIKFIGMVTSSAVRRISPHLLPEPTSLIALLDVDIPSELDYQYRVPYFSVSLHVSSAQRHPIASRVGDLSMCILDRSADGQLQGLGEEGRSTVCGVSLK